MYFFLLRLSQLTKEKASHLKSTSMEPNQSFSISGCTLRKNEHLKCQLLKTLRPIYKQPEAS